MESETVTVESWVKDVIEFYTGIADIHRRFKRPAND